jgi:hypothetical protein
VSLSQDPAFSILKQYFVCGVRDISGLPFSGFSESHRPDGVAVNTSNGAGPHNIQLFVLSADGTVLTCLPGFWNPQDLVAELQLAEDLNRVWLDPHLTRSQKDNWFRTLQLRHIKQHSTQMVSRSQMQGFDKQYEVKHRLRYSDAIADRNLAAESLASGGMAPDAAFKTTDIIMHERMANQPFVPYDQFKIASFIEYGRPQYDKNENMSGAGGGQASASKQVLKGISKGALQVLNHI